MAGAESEERLEGGHRGASAVVAEDELVEVDGQVLVADAAVPSGHFSARATCSSDLIL